MTNSHKLKASKDMNDTSPIYTCDTRMPGADKSAAGQFFPVFAGEVTKTNDFATFEGKCFNTIEFAFTQTSPTQFEVKTTTKDKKKFECDETILYANTEIQHFEVFALEREHTIVFDMSSTDTQADVAYNGISLFGFCEGIVGEIESLFNFAKCFVGGLSLHPNIPYIGSHVPPYMERANKEFLSEAMSLELVEREV